MEKYNKDVISSYWTKKNERAAKAKKHHAEMEKIFKDYILLSVDKTKIYGTEFLGNDGFEDIKPKVIVEDIDSVGAVLKYADNEGVAVLNFASYKNPGGRFLEGSSAQEEALCHESFLYSVLSRLVDRFYNWNNFNKNKSLYMNRGLYTPGIYFMRGKEFKKADVITCAAPNKAAAQTYLKVSDVENYRVLKSRIKFVLDIAKDNNVKTLILGAFGCGVFGQDATEVAEIFKEYLDTGMYGFETVVFAIPNGSVGNLQKFETVFK